MNALAANLVEAGEDEESEAFKRVHQLDVEICSLYAIVATGKRLHHSHTQRPLRACLVLDLTLTSQHQPWLVLSLSLPPVLAYSGTSWAWGTAPFHVTQQLATKEAEHTQKAP